MESTLYYAQVVNITFFMEINTITTEQSKATKFTKYTVEPILDYCATHLNEKIRYKNLT